MDPLNTMKVLKEMTGMQEISHVTTFRCYRDIREVGMKEVTVELLDHGPDAGMTRYSCTATTEDGRKATGNPGGSIEEVLAIVHWANLDSKG